MATKRENTSSASETSARVWGGQRSPGRRFSWGLVDALAEAALRRSSECSCPECAEYDGEAEDVFVRAGALAGARMRSHDPA